MSRLEVNNLNHYFGTAHILKDISLELIGKQFISIIGPNGCGKTTFVKKILKNYVSNRKTIYLNHEDIQGIGSKRFAQTVASVPQNTKMDYDFTVEEMVAMGRHPYVNRFKGESSLDRTIVEEVLKETELYELRERSFPTLSGGERQRVIIARALAQKPDVLILDEPINHLDIKHKVEIMKLLKRLSAKEDLMVVTILHDLNFSLHYSDYCVLLHQGQLYDVGDPKEVITKDNIQNVYQIEVTITNNKERGKMVLYH